MSLKKFAQRLQSLGCETTVTGNKIEVINEGNEVYTEVPDEWIKAINGFFRARQYQFDEESKALTANKFVEFQIIRLNVSYLPRPEYKFTSKNGDVVTIQPASKQFLLSYFNSDAYKDSFGIIERRIKRRSNFKNKKKSAFRIRFEDFLLVPNTATYSPKKKLAREKLKTLGRSKIKSCLFNLAFSIEECWEIRDEIKTEPFDLIGKIEETEDLEIPNVTYNEDLVKHYKIAKSSQFPGQAFLSYYHILEYHFLRVADDNLFSSLKSHLNKPNFKPTYDNVNKLLATIKKHDNIHDETEMLKAVLKKYVVEDELIDFLKDVEKEIGKKIYSDSNGILFGEKMYIKMNQGHALSNTAKVVKHIRNSLVHSSDRHNRNECFMPFSETESIVIQHIPIVKYLAEKVLFSTAK